ncbi:Repeat domain-containing protein [Pseudarcicella hirudinis]|uniref:Repeat domain-containing protein n=1 Tax=Pseudarcicella hirudinis TaxID=1079859 RepID=A0A1I5MC72_9BACT|nr:VCBS repeat-containing protein [Pseudarcicella hirudinis]SFP07110.1 Repeat domain-containing protein [Pseudarcicella hirudinis]
MKTEIKYVSAAKSFFRILWVFFTVLTFSRCKNPEEKPVFELLSDSQTNITFSNDLKEDEFTNSLVYEYSYNGGGVATGDLNNDGLDDIYFSANQKSNKLYLNLGKLKFQDITEAAGVACAENWKTGVTLADVNGDGKLDIYVCRSGNLEAEKRKNLLYINQGNDRKGIPHFLEEGEKYGLADPAFSSHAAFFDYDHDGDLDMLLLNHSPRRFENLDESTIRRMMNTHDELTGVKLYQNNQNFFKDITSSSGILNTRLSYGLGVSISDVNNDGWQDIYLSNDYLAPDYLFINNQNGTFSDKTDQMLSHTSQFSMGNDVSDFNNDGWTDIMTMDMLPEDNHRQKLLFANDNYELFELRERAGLHKQYMRNMLHLNNGDGTFSEIGQFSGVSNTDWSWAPLFADYDNDGWKDLFITNGYVHDYTNMDFLKYMGDYLRDNQGRVQRKNLLDLVKKMPSSNVKNYIFSNNQNLTFTNKTEFWGMGQDSNSNGAAYSDLDNDGDLDLVVNNIDAKAFVYKNNSNEISHHNYLRVKLKGEGNNKFGIGAKVSVFCKGSLQTQEQLMSRGFQSSVSPVLHFGLANYTKADSILIRWNSGKKQVLKNVPVNKLLELQEKNALPGKDEKSSATEKFFVSLDSPVNFEHLENQVNDFKRQPLLTGSLSFSGPCMTKADVNGDGLEDLYIGGAAGQEGVIFIQEKKGSFKKSDQKDFASSKDAEKTDAVFFDADHDGDMDLYVCTGGYDDFLPDDMRLQDYLYFNDGKGRFTLSLKAIPLMISSGSCVRVGDVNGDGHPDLFVGGRVIPGRYPENPGSYVLINDGKGNFIDQTYSIAKGLKETGMITDAAWTDLNGDKKPDLIVIGEWMPVRIWLNNHGKLTEETTGKYFDKVPYGCWTKLLLEDFNGDGKMDLLAGNSGLNAQIKASEQYPAELLYKDFDENNAIDPILSYYIQGKSYPYISRDELLDQISAMRTRFPDYKSYADAAVKDVFSEDELKNARYLKADTFETKLFLSNSSGKFREEKLPEQVQFTPWFAIKSLDFNHDGKKDLILGGNVSHTRIKMGQCSASFGTTLKGDGKGHFSFVPNQISGLQVRGDIRSFLEINDLLLIGVNNQPLKTYRLINK